MKSEGPTTSTSSVRPLTFSIIPGRNQVQAYKLWRFKSISKCHSYSVENHSIAEVIQWCAQISDSKISFEELFLNRGEEFTGLDAQLFSALVNATDGSNWGDELCQLAMDECEDTAGRQFLRKLDQKFLVQHRETATLATQALHAMSCKRIEFLESYIVNYKRHIKTCKDAGEELPRASKCQVLRSQLRHLDDLKVTFETWEASEGQHDPEDLLRRLQEKVERLKIDKEYRQEGHGNIFTLDKCSYCKKPGHVEDECRKKQHHLQKKTDGQNNFGKGYRTPHGKGGDSAPHGKGKGDPKKNSVKGKGKGKQGHKGQSPVHYTNPVCNTCGRRHPGACWFDTNQNQVSSVATAECSQQNDLSQLLTNFLADRMQPVNRNQRSGNAGAFLADGSNVFEFSQATYDQDAHYQEGQVEEDDRDLHSQPPQDDRYVRSRPEAVHSSTGESYNDSIGDQAQRYQVSTSSATTQRPEHLSTSRPTLQHQELLSTSRSTLQHPELLSTSDQLTSTTTQVPDQLMHLKVGSQRQDQLLPVSSTTQDKGPFSLSTSFSQDRGPLLFSTSSSNLQLHSDSTEYVEFVVDTGASEHCVNDKTAKSYGLPCAGPRVSMRTASRKESSSDWVIIFIKKVGWVKCLVLNNTPNLLSQGRLRENGWEQVWSVGEEPQLFHHQHGKISLVEINRVPRLIINEQELLQDAFDAVKPGVDDLFLMIEEVADELNGIVNVSKAANDLLNIFNSCTSTTSSVGHKNSTLTPVFNITDEIAKMLGKSKKVASKKVKFQDEETLKADLTVMKKLRKLLEESNSPYTVEDIDEAINNLKKAIDDLPDPQHRLPQELQKFGGSLSADTVGPIAEGVGGAQYIATGVDRFTDYRWAVPMKENNAVTSRTTWERNLIGDRKLAGPGEIHTDNGPEFSGHFSEGMRNLGLKHTKAIPHYPQNNSRDERFNGEMLGEVRTALARAYAPTSFWPWAVEHWILHENEKRGATARRFGHAEKRRLVPFGCQAVAKIHARPPDHKFDTPGKLVVIVGYANDMRGSNTGYKVIALEDIVDDRRLQTFIVPIPYAHIQTDIFPLRDISMQQKSELWEGPLPLEKCPQCHLHKTDAAYSCDACRGKKRRHARDHTCRYGRCECSDLQPQFHNFDFEPIVQEEQLGDSLLDSQPAGGETRPRNLANHEAATPTPSSIVNFDMSSPEEEGHDWSDKWAMCDDCHKHRLIQDTHYWHQLQDPNHKFTCADLEHNDGTPFTCQVPEHPDAPIDESNEEHEAPEFPREHPAAEPEQGIANIARKIKLRSDEAKKPAAKAAIQAEMQRLGPETGTIDFDNPKESWEAAHEYPDAQFTDLLMKLTSKHDELGEAHAEYKGRGCANGMYITNAQGKRIFVKAAEDSGIPASYTSIRCVLANSAIKYVNMLKKKESKGLQERHPQADCQQQHAQGFGRNGFGYLGPKARPQNFSKRIRVGDVAGAYLLARLGGPPVFVRVKKEHIPEEYRAKWELLQDPVARVNQALYGLQRSMGDWKQTLEHVLIDDMHFKKIETEDSVYIKDDVTLTVYVDDIIMDSGNDSQVAEQIQAELEERLPIKFKPLNEDPRFLGINIQASEDPVGNVNITLGQIEYAKKVVEEFETLTKTRVHNSWTPFVESTDDADADKQPGKYKWIVKKMIGSLLHLQRCTRGDIAFAVGRLARHAEKWSIQDDRHLLRLVGYVKATANIQLHWHFNINDEKVYLLTYADSDFAGDLSDNKSTSGYVTVLYGKKGTRATLDWGSKKQSVITKATGEAEIIAMVTAMSRSAYPISIFYEELGHKIDLFLITDSSAARSAVENPQTSKMRYMKKSCRISLAWIQNQIERREFNVQQCASSDNLSDMNTKALPRTTFELLRKRCGWSINPQN